MGAAATVEGSAMERGYGMTAADISMRYRRHMINIPRPRAVTRPVAIPRMPVNWPSVVAVIPRARADENAPREPARSVIAIRRASVRIVAIISVRTNRCRSNTGNDWPNTKANGDLCLGAASQCKKQNSQKCDIF
jgi:hypothetical protein